MAPALVLLLRLGLRPAVTATAVLTVASVVWRAAVAETRDWDRVYLGTDTRAAALLIGCLAAFVAHSGLRVGAGAGAVCAAALVWMLAGGWLADGPWGIPLTTFEVVLATLVISLLRSDGGVAPLLGAWPLAYAGRISYGLYLWHVPIFLATEPSSYLEAGVAGTVSIDVAALSMRYVEAPFLSERRRMATTVRVRWRRITPRSTAPPAGPATEVLG